MENSRVSRPSVYWIDYAITVVVALGLGVGIGAMFHRQLLGDPIPWFAAAEAVAVDGDTIRITALLHLNGMDAPETDRERCPGEQAQGLRARDRANELLGAGPVRVKILGEDRHGRISALFASADRSLAETLLREGLVQKALAGRWCPGDTAKAPPVNPASLAFLTVDGRAIHDTGHWPGHWVGGTAD